MSDSKITFNARAYPMSECGHNAMSAYILNDNLLYESTCAVCGNIEKKDKLETAEMIGDVLEYLAREYVFKKDRGIGF